MPPNLLDSHPIFLAILMALLVAAGSAVTAGDALGRAPLTLVRDGRPKAVITISADASPAAQIAAAELRRHIRLITGVDLEIRDDTEEPPVEGHVQLLVGESRATRDLGLRSADFAEQEYAIRSLPGTIVLMGRDSAGSEIAPVRVNYEDPEATNFPDPFDNQGTLLAVYDFLEKECGVRWYLPTDLGTVHPVKKMLAISSRSIRRRPWMGYREISGVRPRADLLSWDRWDTPSNELLSLRETRLWWMRMRMGGAKYSANHSFMGWYDRFLADHPDYFAKGYPGRPPQLCYSNPAVIDQVVRDARDYFDGKGAVSGAFARGDVFALVPMDNASWCKCDRCQTRLHPGNDYFSNNRASEYVWGFVNAVAREVRKTHPDKWIAALAYHEYSFPPETVRLEPNIAVQMCLHVKNWWSPGMEENDTRMFRAWVDSGEKRPLYLWLYYCFPYETGLVNGYSAFPGFATRTIARQIRLFRKAGIRGAFLNEYPTSPLNHLDHCMTFRLFDDPDQDVGRLMDEFFRLYYGGAAKPMRAFYRKAEDLFTSPESYPEEIQTERRHRHMSEDLSWKALCPRERLEEFRALLVEARSKARNETERRRIDLFDRDVFQAMERGLTRFEASRKKNP